MFSNVVVSALAFLAALGLLISIHEYGHFWVARRVGIKVLRYSIGFGKALIRHTGRVDNTEYVLAAIPLGGYVKMLDEREGSVPVGERHRAFNQQPLWARSAVVIAGPLANFLLAIVAYWIVMMIGISGIAPLVGAPVLDSAAAKAGFQYEDRIVSVNGQNTPTWTDARIALLESSMSASGPLDIEVESASGEQLVRQLPVSQADMLKSDGDAVANLGFRIWWPEVDPIIGEVTPEGAAAGAGLLAGDRILSINGERLDSWRSLVEIVQPSAGVQLNLVIERGGENLPLQLTPEAVQVGSETVGRIGVLETQSAGIAEKARVVVKHPPLEAFGEALVRTWDMSALTLRMMGKLLLGQASLDNISGPISIAQYAGQSASTGIDHYINFIALISISLAVLNLLPIPMLDGGHLLFFAAEAIRGKPLSERVQVMGQQVGIALLGGLMFLAFYNDLWRLFQ
ncbi:RIP metalloprotease RseP [Granulosicoccus antarcticus]|uniref:Zinc metalloprotease n=1 Tax=Granulosicoccus antarcticus IMCC3135 TaxID=1192854 RepID=A0A2Z2NZ19_9GAMM|nr:RIP metalloprotease RseP [Granulosicoccus antarcticus]ASJ75161.1 Regulator of sigma-E protease RseP [Granulosicoccus antarcticus IMCC3135]